MKNKKITPLTPPNVLFTAQQAAQNKTQAQPVSDRETAVLWLITHTNFTFDDLAVFDDEKLALMVKRHREANNPPHALL